MIYEMLAEHEENAIVTYEAIQDLINGKLETAIRNFGDSFRFIIESIQSGEGAEKQLPDLFKCINKFCVIMDEAINKIFHNPHNIQKCQLVVNHYEPIVKLILAALTNEEFMNGFGDSRQEMIKEKVDVLGGIRDMMAELKLAIMKRRVKMLYLSNCYKIIKNVIKLVDADPANKYHLVDDYRGIVSAELPETGSFFAVTEKLNNMLYNRQVHVLFNKTVHDFNGNFVFPLAKEEIDIMQNALKTNASVFPPLEDVLCSSEKVTTGERAPDEVINFGTDNEAKFLAVDSFDDAEF